MRMVKGLDYYYDRDSGFMIVACDEKRYYEDIYMVIDGYKFQVTVDDYFFVFPDLGPVGFDGASSRSGTTRRMTKAIPIMLSDTCPREKPSV